MTTHIKKKRVATDPGVCPPTFSKKVGVEHRWRRPWPWGMLLVQVCVVECVLVKVYVPRIRCRKSDDPGLCRRSVARALLPGLLC